MSSSSKLSAFLAYVLPVLGWVYVFAARKNDQFAVFHTMQSMGIFVVAVGALIAWLVFGWIISFVPFFGFIITVALFSLVLLVFITMAVNWIIGVINVWQARLKPLPMTGSLIANLVADETEAPAGISYSRAQTLYESDIIASADDVTVNVIGFGRRLGATLIDVAILSFLIFLVILALSMLAWLYESFRPYTQTPFANLFILLGLIISLVYYIGFWTRSGQTIGLAVTGIKVIGTDGAPLSSGQAFTRYFGYIVSGLLFSIGFLWVTFDKKRQGWHDKLANTLVVNADDRFYSARSVEYVPSDPGKSWVWIGLWVVIGLVSPIGYLSSLWFLGPFINGFLNNIFPGL